MNSQRIWGITLGVSLTVNVFCIAALLSYVLGGQPGSHHKRAPLPPEARALFRELNLREMPGFRESINLLKQRREAVRSALVAEPFDPEKLDLAFAQLRESEAQKARFAHDRVTEVASKLAPEERRIMAEFVGRRGTKRGPDGPGKLPRANHD